MGQINAGFSGPGYLLLYSFESDAKSGSLPLRAGYIDSGLVFLKHLASNGQAQSGPLRLIRKEGIEDFAQVFLGYPHPGVADQ